MANLGVPGSGVDKFKEGKNKKQRLRDFEIEKIVSTFQKKKAIDDFSVAVTYNEIKEKGYSLAAGQYFDIKIEYSEITPEEFKQKIAVYSENLNNYFNQSKILETEIIKNLGNLEMTGK